MALTLVNNNYVGDIKGGLASLVTIGAIDLGMFHIETTMGSKVRFAYVDVTATIQSFDSLCAVTDDGDRSREIIDVELVRCIHQQSACIDEEFTTDSANANGGYLSQTADPESVAEWSRMLVDKFSFKLQETRWSGDTASSDSTLSKHDGVVKRIQAKNAFDSANNPEGYQKVATTVVTATNAIQEIQKVYAAVENFAFFVTNDPSFKIVISPKIAALLRQQIQGNNNTTGLTSLPKISYNGDTGQLTTGDFFGAPVYVAYGLNATPANSNIIMAGIFVDNRSGVLKYGTVSPNEDKTIDIRVIDDGDKIRMRIIHAQNVAIIPNVSQVAMNI